MFYERFDLGSENALHSNIGIFTSGQDMSSRSYAGLQSSADAALWGKTSFSGAAAGESNVFTPPPSSTDDTTPTLSGSLGAALSAGEKVGIYDGATRLGDATVTHSGRLADT